MRNLCLFLVAFMLVPCIARGQYENKSLEAVRCAVAPDLDGKLQDACWLIAPKTSGFVMNSPVPGIPLTHPTEVQVVYDDVALYVAIMNYDTAPDSILQQLSGRDGDGNSDYCGVSFSCYRDGINGFTFIVSPTAEQWDARIMYGADEDVSWNAVWDCKTSIQENGWVAEFRIPFAAIRFPDVEEQVWDVNFIREIRRTRHKGFWRGVDPTVRGFATQMGTLHGIKNVKPPKRIFFTPYASGYYNAIEREGGGMLHETSWNAGMDVKIGLNDAFTLDATLVPDFGQVISDQRILNLSPFEVQFQDNRQFFIEGTELFSRGDLFYTRRIGYLPEGFSPDIPLKEGEEITSLPGQLQLLNASKVSGRTSGGLGIGVFNAVTSRTFAGVTDSQGNTRSVEIYPLTNYNVTVLDQNLKNNSYVTLINTNVLRNGGYYDANATGTTFDLRNKKNSYSMTGTAIYNRKFGGAYKEVRRDREGFTQGLDLNKISGNWRWSTGMSMKSDTYDPRDLGFLQANNSVNYYASTGYNIFKPFWKLNSLNSSLYMSYNQLYNPRAFTDVYLESSTYIDTKKFTTYNLTLSSMPSRGADYFEPRIRGMKFVTYKWFYSGGWISTDYRKPLAIDAGGGNAFFENGGRYEWNWFFSPRVRVNDHLFIVYRYQKNQHENDLGFARFDVNNQPLFGRRNVISHTNTLTVNYAFNPLMTVMCRVRHYWGYSKYKEFYSLRQDGLLGETGFDGFADDDGNELIHSNSDRNFNSFTIDLIYRWIFVPGSEVSVVWKNDITKAEFGRPVAARYTDDLEYTLNLPQSNSLSIRVLYFLDYHSLFSRKNAG